MTTLLRWLVRASVRLLPSRSRERVGAEWACVVDALARDAQARGGAAAERRYLMQELADMVRQGLALRRADRWSLRDAVARLPDAIHDDFRASLRQCRKRPAATVGVIATLAVAVAAVTTTYGLAASVLWRTLPFPASERLVFVWESGDDASDPFRVTAGRFAEWQRESRSFASMALFGAAGFSLDGPDGSRPVRGVRVSASFFETLGLASVLGRTLTADDEVPGRHRVVVLSEGTWRSRFGGDPGVIGRTVRLSGEPYEVVGVMPDVVTPGWPTNPARVAVERDLRELWVPIPRTPELAANFRSHVFGVVGRLREGVSAAVADAELQALRSASSNDPHVGVTTSFREQFVRDVRVPLLVLFAASIAVLLVACANLAALQVSRFEQRRVELATRLALGAGRMRVAGLLAVDAALLSALGGAVGIWLAHVALSWIPGQLPASMPFVTSPRLDAPAVVFAGGLAGLVALGLSLWPMARVSGVSLSSRGTTVSGQARVYRWLVVGQVSIGVALAVPASLLGQSLASLRAREPGFAVDGVLVADVSATASESAVPGRVSAFERSIRDVLATRPGVGGVAFAYDHPLEANWTQIVTLDGDVTVRASDEIQVQLRIVSPSYFETLGVNILDGRPFEEREDWRAPGVAVVNEAFAAAHGERLLGRRLRTSAATSAWGPSVPSDYAIVGVAENERFLGLEESSAPAVYLSTLQFPLTDASVLVRADAGTRRVAAELRQEIRRAEPDATVGQVSALEDILSDQLASRRVTADVVSAFALAAVALAALGLYGLMAVVVAARVREVGVRLALGASPGQVARGVMMEGIGWAAVGVAAGLALAFALGRFVEHLLVDVSAHDPVTLTAVSRVLFGTASAAAASPARRAARI
ncbi:MAG: ADOP family duplicated permease, partial [Vicinamibacterales bacterium]